MRSSNGAQEPVAVMSRTKKISEDVTKVWRLALLSVDPRDRECKKGDCTALDHKENEHCRQHYEYGTLKEDSDKLHSINIAIAVNILPNQVIKIVGAQARLAESA